MDRVKRGKEYFTQIRCRSGSKGGICTMDRKVQGDANKFVHRGTAFGMPRSTTSAGMEMFLCVCEMGKAICKSVARLRYKAATGHYGLVSGKSFCFKDARNFANSKAALTSRLAAIKADMCIPIECTVVIVASFTSICAAPGISTRAGVADVFGGRYIITGTFLGSSDKGL